MFAEVLLQFRPATVPSRMCAMYFAVAHIFIPKRFIALTIIYISAQLRFIYVLPTFKFPKSNSHRHHAFNC